MDSFIQAIFSSLNLKLDDGFFTLNMPEVFIKTGCDLSDIIIDWTEFKLQQPGNYDLSTLTFLNYKNIHIWKIWL